MKDYVVQIVHEFKIQAENVQDAHKKGGDAFRAGSVGVSCVRDLEEHKKYVALGMEEEFDSILLQDPVFASLAKASGTPIHDADSLKEAIAFLNPERVEKVKKALKKEAASTKMGSAYQLGIEFALEILECGGEEMYLEDDLEQENEI